MTMTKLTRLIALALLFYPVAAEALHVKSDAARVDLTTDKVAHLTGDVDVASLLLFQIEIAMTSALPGPRIVVIDSPGGYEIPGREIIAALEADRARGAQAICVATRSASSMAFNLFTHCDIRLATEHTKFLVHKLALVDANISCAPRCTAKKARELADGLEKDDQPYRTANATALNISLADYDLFADNERIWTTADLIAHGYLHGLAQILP